MRLLVRLFALLCTPLLAAPAAPEYPLQRWSLESQQQRLAMAYLDILPQQPAQRTIVLLHGKNFCSPYFESLIPTLLEAGYRVIAPEQIGFCRSDMPQRYQYSLHQLALNTRALLAALGIERSVVLGHSMGGMLAVRYALMFPGHVEKLLLVAPIGLEDWKALGVPYQSIDRAYAQELKTDYARIKAYQQQSYYGGRWRPEYERWARMLADLYAEQRERVAWSQALTSDMIFTQPVIHELDRLRVPTALIVGERDATAIGRDRAPPEIAAGLGDYPALARRAVSRIPDAELVLLQDIGHLPHIEAPQRFSEVLAAALP